MNKKLLPRDLRKFSTKQRGKVAVFLLLVAVAFVGVYISCNLSSTAEKVSIAALLLFLFGIIMVKVFPKLTDKSYSGEVTDVIIKTGVEMPWMFKRSYVQPRRNTIVLGIQLENGKCIWRQVYCEHAEVHSKQEELSLHIEKYRVGDKVFHLAGTQHTIVVPNLSDFRVQCAVCGSFVNIEQDCCCHCNHSLIKK